MPVRYDPLLSRALAAEIERRWKGTGVSRLVFDRDRRVASLRFAAGSCLLALLHPTAGQLLALDSDPDAGSDAGSGSEVPTGFTPAGDEVGFRRITLMEASGLADERSIVIKLADPGDRVRHILALELLTNQWNALLLAPHPGEAWGRIERLLWIRTSGGRHLAPAARYTPPASTREAIEAPPDRESWIESIAAVEPSERRRALLSRWAYSSALNVRWILGQASETDPEAAGYDAAYHRYLSLHPGAPTTADSGEPLNAWLIPKRWGLQPYIATLDDDDAEAADSLLAAMGRAVESSGGIDELLAAAGPAPGSAATSATLAEATRLESEIRSRVSRIERRVRALERQLDSAGSPDEPRLLGQLLLAHKARVTKGADRIRLPDFEGEEREIELDPVLDVVANAERYFDEARRRQRAREALPGEIAAAERDATELRAALERLEREGPSNELRESAGLPEAGAGDRAAGGRRGRRASSTEPARRVPYTRLRSSGGLEIRVGRGARDNDDLTFRHSAPDDIWLHARQTGGAHVVLRWGKTDENPPQRDLLEAAVAAAVSSGARHSGAVAVDWTRRKYVRKPRKAPPGTVTVERVKTLFVEPDAKLIERLRVE